VCPGYTRLRAGQARGGPRTGARRTLRCAPGTPGSRSRLAESPPPHALARLVSDLLVRGASTGLLGVPGHGPSLKPLAAGHAPRVKPGVPDQASPALRCHERVCLMVRTGLGCALGQSCFGCCRLCCGVIWWPQDGACEAGPEHRMRRSWPRKALKREKTQGV